jgi:hypothetical protein
MAGVTFTYTANMAESARAVHAGVNAIIWDFNSKAVACGSISDVICLGKIPAHCTILPGSVITMGASAAAAVHWMLLGVDSADYTKSGGTIYGSMTQTTAKAIFTVDRPTKVSLSADSTAAHAVLYLNCTTSASPTVSVSIQGCLLYTCDGRSVV